MILRIYVFILLGTLIENAWHFWHWMGYSDEFVYFTVFPVCQRAEVTLLPLFWLMQRLFHVRVNEDQRAWIYLISATYFIFQVMDVVDTAINANTRPAGIDFILFIALNLTYWRIFRKKSN